jgi:hypothetical protein
MRRPHGRPSRWRPARTGKPENDTLALARVLVIEHGQHREQAPARTILPKPFRPDTSAYRKGSGEKYRLELATTGFQWPFCNSSYLFCGIREKAAVGQ